MIEIDIRQEKWLRTKPDEKHTKQKMIKIVRLETSEHIKMMNVC